MGQVGSDDDHSIENRVRPPTSTAESRMMVRHAVVVLMLGERRKNVSRTIGSAPRHDDAEIIAPNDSRFGRGCRGFSGR